MTVNEVCDSYLTHCRTERNLTLNTIQAYRFDLASFLTFSKAKEPSNHMIDQCSRTHLRAFIMWLTDERQLRPRTVRRRLTCVKGLFRWLEITGILSPSPFSTLDVRISLPEPLPRCLSNGDVSLLMTNTAIGAGFDRMRQYEARPPESNTRNTFNRLTAVTCLELLLATGLRVSELCAGRVEHLEPDCSALRVWGKGRRERRVFIASQAVRNLVHHYLRARAVRARDGVTTLVVTVDGRPGTSQFVRRLIKRSGEHAGIRERVTPHMLRHTCATELVDAGLDIRFVQRLLGHRSITTTQIYAHVSDRSLEGAIARVSNQRKSNPER